MLNKDELCLQGYIYYLHAVNELIFKVGEETGSYIGGFEYEEAINESEHVVDNGNRVKISFKTTIESFDEDIILEASCVPYEIDNISYVIKCGSFHSQVEIPVTDLSKLEEYVARCIYVYEEKNKQYKELCQKALDSLSRPSTFYAAVPNPSKDNGGTVCDFS